MVEACGLLWAIEDRVIQIPSLKQRARLPGDIAEPHFDIEPFAVGILCRFRLASHLIRPAGLRSDHGTDPGSSKAVNHQRRQLRPETAAAPAVSLSRFRPRQGHPLALLQPPAAGVAQVLPGSVLLHLRRDPRDLALSLSMAATRPPARSAG